METPSTNHIGMTKFLKPRVEDLLKASRGDLVISETLEELRQFQEHL